MAVEVIRYQDPREYDRVVSSYLQQAPVANVLLLTQIGGAVRNETVDAWCYMAAVLSGGEVIGAAFMEPPRHLLLAGRSQTPLEAIAGDLVGWSVQPPAVLGPGTAAHFFAVRYAHLSGVDQFPGIQQHLLALREVRAVTEAAGSLQVATQRDLGTVTSWIVEAGFELKGRSYSHEQAHRTAVHLIEDSRLFLWWDDGAAAMVAVEPQTPTISMIDLVFTPPERRGRGYGTAGVAAICHRLLQGEVDTVILFSGPGDPVANHVYAKIGFKHVTDYHEYHFDERTYGQQTAP